MPKKQSSSRLSAIAGGVLANLNHMPNRKWGQPTYVTSLNGILVSDVKALAASVLSQDEKKGNPKVTTIRIRSGKDFGWKIYEGKVQTAFSPRKADAVTIAKQQAARLKPSRVVLHVGKTGKTLKEFK